MPGLLFSRSHSVASQAMSDRTEDYVEDSEPEREERRLRGKSRRKNLKKTRSNVRPQPVVDVIELSDSDASSASLARPPPPKAVDNPLIVIDVSDGSDFASVDRLRGQEGSSRGEAGDVLYVDTNEDTTLDESLPSIRQILGLRKPTASPTVARVASSNPIERNSLEAPPSRPPRLLPLSTAGTTEESDEGDQGPLMLSRFAYTNPKALRRSASKTPTSSERDSSTPDVQSIPGKVKRVPPPSSHAFMQDFTDTELSRIRKCVSCETSWTIRKSVANKMKHIEVCARKKKLTHETIRVLLQKELDNMPPVASTSKLPIVEPAPVVPETLLEETVKDVQKKRGRRPQVQLTVKSLEETRSNILDRARMLLKDTRNTVSSIATRKEQPEVPAADTNHVFGLSRLARVSRAQIGVIRTGADIAGDSDISPLTQDFSTSVLDARRSSTGPVSADIDKSPPATQAFTSSKSTDKCQPTGTNIPHDDPLDEPISLHDTSEDDERSRSSPRPISISSSPSSNANLQHSSSSPTSRTSAEHSLEQPPLARIPSTVRLRRSPTPVGDAPRAHSPEELGYDVQDDHFYDRHDWNNDGFWDQGDVAYLHYTPDENSAGPVPSDPSRQALTQDSRTSTAPPRLSAILEDLPIPGNNVDVQTPVEAPPKKKTRRKKAAATEEDDAQAQTGTSKDISQEDLNMKLKQAILKDETLHLRVLRYEPIHFDVFMKLATDLGIPAKRSGLKGKVRTFLDEKAIHFYGADPSKSRTRRTRHP